MRPDTSGTGFPKTDGIIIIIPGREPFFLNFGKDEHVARMDHFKDQLGRRVPNDGQRDRMDLLSPVPTEDLIKQRFKMRIPVRVDQMENNFSDIGVLTHPTPGIEMINDHARCIRRDLADLRAQEKRLKEEMNTFSNKMNDELDSMKTYLMDTFSDFWAQLRQNGIEHQNQQAHTHKDIQKLKNDRDELTENLCKEFEKLGIVENILFKKQVFDLETNDAELRNVERDILRREHANLPNYEPIKAIPKSYDAFIHKTKRKPAKYES